MDGLAAALKCLNHKDGPCNPGWQKLSEEQGAIIRSAFGHDLNTIKRAWKQAHKPKFNSIQEFGKFIDDKL